MKLTFYYVISAIMIFLGGNTAHSQYAWSNLGPDNLGGLTRALAFDANGNLLAGSQGGGLWISEDEGISWKRVLAYDAAGGNPNITTIAVDGQTIYIGTGAVGYQLPYVVTDLNTSERNYDFRDQPEGFKGYLPGLPGNGVWVSKDNGASWSNDNASTKFPVGGDTKEYKGPFVGINKIYIRDGRIFLATIEGLYYSDNELKSLFPAFGSGVFESSIVYDVEGSGDNVIFAGTHSLNRNDSLYISTDNGTTFRAVEDRIFYERGIFSFGRTEIATYPSDPSIVYVGSTSASGELNGILRSDDSGNSWRIYAPKGSPGFTPLGTGGRNAFILSVFPDNPDEVIVAGANWYTFQEGRGWTQTLQHNVPTFTDYLGRSMFTILFDPQNSEKLFVGTSRQVFRSVDRAKTFRQRSKGYEAAVTYSVAATGNQEQEAVIAGTALNGTIYNQHFNSENSAIKQGFGPILGNNFGEVATSSAFPGGLIAKGNDDAIMRSLNSGESFERFYGTPRYPDGLPGITDTVNNIYIDRIDAVSEGGSLINKGTPAQTPWVLDERIPENLVGNPNSTKIDIQEKAEIDLYFCSKNFVWVVDGAFGDGLQVKWDRITDQLVDGVREYFTAITVAPDEDHTIYVGTSKGNLWKIKGAHDLETYNAANNVAQINEDFASNLAVMNGRWISSIAVDPQNTDRVIITYAGYGGSIAGTPTFVWMTADASADIPVFGRVTGAPRNEPIYSSQFVVDPASDESVLMLGTETGLYTLRKITGSGSSYSPDVWRNELSGEMGRIPIYDIYVRPFTSQITNEETQDFTLTPDNTVFVATHGRGIWATTSVSFNRKENPGPDEPLVDIVDIQIYPNPTNSGKIYLALELPEASRVEFDMIQADGKQVNTAVLDLESGVHKIPFEISSLSSGIYFSKVVVNGKESRTIKHLKTFIRE